MMSVEANSVASLRSPLEGVSDEAWSTFVSASLTAKFDAVSPSNHLGAFEMTPRRLQDLGFLYGVKKTQSKKSGRSIWVGKFIPPLTDKAFLKNPQIQFAIFKASMTDYSRRIAAGEIQLPPGIGLAGALAILHRAGPAGLKGRRFESTQAAFEKVSGLF